jgi:PEGA domain
MAFLGRRALLCGAALLITLAMSSMASASPDGTVVLAEGSTALRWVELAQASAETVTARLGRPIVAAKRIPIPGGKSFKTCFQESFDTCGRKLLAKGTTEPVRSVLVLGITEDTQNTSSIVLTGWLVETRGGSTVVSDRRFCERCTEASFEALVEELTTQILRVNGSGLTTKIRVESVPEGAEVQVDNVLIGVTPVETSTSPGPHTISLRKDGYQVAVRQVEAITDETKSVTVTLEESRRKGLGLAPWKWASLGAGVALVAWGGVELLRYEPEVKDGETQPQHRDTRLVGGLLLGGGVVLVGTSVVLFILDARRPPPVQAGVAWDGGGNFTLTMTGRF